MIAAYEVHIVVWSTVLVSVAIHTLATVTMATRDKMDIFSAIVTESFDRLQRIVTSIPDINIRNSRQQTPLIASMFMGDKTVLVNTVRLLIRHGSDVNAQDEQGRSPLMLACMNKDRLDAVELLGKNPNCDLNLKDRDGNTALHHAVDSGNSMAIRALVTSSSARRKIKMNEPNNSGLSPYKLSERLKHVRCSRMLLKHGGSEIITEDDKGPTNSIHDTQKVSHPMKARPESRASENKIRESLQSLINESRTKTPFDMTARSVKTPKPIQPMSSRSEVPPMAGKTFQETSGDSNPRFSEKSAVNRGLPKLRPKSEVLPLTSFLNPYKSFNRPLSDRRVVTISRDTRDTIIESRHLSSDGSTYFESTRCLNEGFARRQGTSRPASRYPAGEKLSEVNRSYRLQSLEVNGDTGNSRNIPPEEWSPTRDFRPGEDLKNTARQRIASRRVLTPIVSAKTVHEVESRSQSPAQEYVRDRLPSIASGKTLYLMTPRQTPSELF
ncbi:hypothetical protein Btru_077595 [Bulinus truncatus]|nr:hypothetical protein Btru_077595 [Bulinus truncatus]